MNPTPTSSCIPTRPTGPWRYIVLHHSASASGNYDQIDGEHRKILGIDGCGYHFVIGNGSGSSDGQIEVSRRWNNQKQGAHTRNARTHDADEYGIGICLVGDFDQQPPSPRQLAATQALIAYLSKRYKIAPSGVRTHAHLAATKTVCPGKYFPSEAMLTVTKDAMAERPVRATWKVVRDTTQKMIGSRRSRPGPGHSGRRSTSPQGSGLPHVGVDSFEPSNGLVQESHHTERVGDLPLSSIRQASSHSNRRTAIRSVPSGSSSP